jgi:hypothetical protein
MDKPTIEQLLEAAVDAQFFIRDYGSMRIPPFTAEQLKDAIRAILSEYPKLQAELAQVKAALALAEPLLKAAMGPDEFKDVSMAEPWVKVTNERYKRIVRESDAYRKAAEAKEGEGETKAR